jgi:glycosyltransferase involved in cell wall biosynthesis
MTAPTANFPMGIVSAVVPVFNSGYTAIRAIESILTQTHRCSEIIVIDDGSSDGSADLLRAHFSETQPLVQIYSIPNRGAAGARNFGLKKVTSQWVAFLDSDDAWLPHKTEVQMQILSGRPKLGLIGALTNMQGFSRFSPKISARLAPVTIHALLFKNYFQTSTVIVKREALLTLGGFPEGRRYAEEGDLFMRIAAKYECALLNEVVVDYACGKPGFGASGLSADLWRMEQGELKNIVAAWRRKDAGSLIVASAISVSLLKFVRRLGVSSYHRITA